MAHSVSGHLQLEIAEYDRRIREFVPAYAEMRRVHLDLIGALLRAPEGRLLDLGGGTGALAAAVLARFPGVTVEIWDTDPAMLAAARERCVEFGDRIVLQQKSFSDPLTPCDGVIACIALHHVKDLEVKGRIYRNVYNALRPRGFFLNADTAIGSDSAVQNWSYAQWVAGMGAHGIDEPAARQHLADWAKEDFYPPLMTELQLLAAAGFVQPDCFWREGPFALFGALR